MSINPKWNYLASGLSAASALFCAINGDATFTLINALFAGLNWFLGEYKEAGRE